MKAVIPLCFTNLKDANYFKDPIALDENKYSYLTYFRQLSQVGFQVHQRTIHTCYGHTTKVPIFFNGNGPFSFEYDFWMLTLERSWLIW